MNSSSRSFGLTVAGMRTVWPDRLPAVLAAATKETLPWATVRDRVHRSGGLVRQGAIADRQRNRALSHPTRRCVRVDSRFRSAPSPKFQL